MKFTRVRLENMFAYDGSVDFDFSGTSPEQNIVLIWGRNGMGKTSFLNSVKLLFTGTTETEFRTVGFPPVTLNLRQYVLGDGVRWTGLVNRNARRRTQNAGRTLDAKVEISWEDESGDALIATRWWAVDGDEVTEGVFVDKGSERIAADAAEDLLANTLPPDFVKFFFFDGEDIKSIAESSGSLQKDIDRLLQITFFEELAGELEKMVGERRRKSLQADIRRQFDEATAERQKAVTAEIEANEKIEELESQLASDGLELRRLAVRRANLSSGASEAQREELEKQKAKLTSRLKALTSEIVNELFAEVPVLANLSMVRQISSHVDSRLAASDSAEAKFVRSISGQLAPWVVEAAPAVSSELAETIALHIDEKLRQLLLTSQPSGLFAAVDTLKIERLRRILEPLLVTGVERREIHAKSLSEAREIKAELLEINDSLLKIEVGAKGNVEEFRAVVNKIAELEEAVSKQNQQKGAWSTKLADAKTKQIEFAKKIKQLEANHTQASQDAEDSRFVAKVAQALNQIAEELKKATREELEVMLNDKFRQIITHPLIDRISLDDTYTMTYHEKGGRPIGRTSLSSGMKQLAATAMLWAMKDSAGRQMPVIIDTPLGRIDRENQDHLLLAYYPALSHQVIILPTNAEIDSRKRGLLEARVAKHYTIVNDNGDAANIEPRPLVELS